MAKTAAHGLSLGLLLELVGARKEGSFDATTQCWILPELSLADGAEASFGQNPAHGNAEYSSPSAELASYRATRSSFC